MTSFTVDVYLDCDDNSKYYKEYNVYRREKASHKESAVCAFSGSVLKLETEQILFYKIIRDVLSGRWVVPVCLRRERKA